MRPALSTFIVIGAAAVSAAACSESPTAGGDHCSVTTAAPLTRAPDFGAVVSGAKWEGGNGPAGYYSQFDLSLMVGAIAPNVGVVLGTINGAVFRRTASGEFLPASACDIQLHDSLDVWHDLSEGYGAVQSPPNTPLFTGLQIVIIRRTAGCRAAIAPDCDGSSLPDVLVGVTVYDSATGSPIAAGASAVFQASAHSRLIPSDGSDSLLVGWGTRGAYQLTVQHPGYRSWVMTGTTSRSDILPGVSAVARLQPAP